MQTCQFFQTGLQSLGVLEVEDDCMDSSSSAVVESLLVGEMSFSRVL